MYGNDILDATKELMGASKLTADNTLETCKNQRRLTEAVKLLGRVAEEMVAINLRLAARLDAICGPMEALGQNARIITDKTRAVAIAVQESEQKLRSIIAPMVVEEPATLSLTSDTVAFSPAEDEFIERKICSLDPTKLQLN